MGADPLPNLLLLRGRKFARGSHTPGYDRPRNLSIYFLDTTLEILSVTLFEKTPILQALQPSDSYENLLDDPNQLILFDF